MPELRKSHLLFIQHEMEALGGTYLKGVSEAHYPNGSVGLFAHCETDADIEKFLSAQFDAIYFDEITTFQWDMVTKISTSCRVPRDSGRIAIIRGGTNPLGVSAEEVYRYYIGRDVTPEEDDEYVAAEWGAIKLNREDNIYLDVDQYDKRFAGLPEAYRKAWLDGIWGVEGAYFDIRDEHLIRELPVVSTDMETRPALQWPWLHVYRVIDWGWHDPTVCLWMMALPDGHEVAFREESWLRTPAATVAGDIRRLTDEQRVVTTFADPTLWEGEKEMGHCLADEFEQRGVALTAGKNDRTAIGMAIQEHLNQRLPDGRPKLLIYEPGCPVLVRSLRAMRVDKKKPGRIADHRLDHLPICLGYFCMAGVGPSRIPTEQTTSPRWMRPKPGTRRILGQNAVRSSVHR
jgi:hypothetical protein